MHLTQEDTEELLRLKAQKRLPTLRKALAKTQERIAGKKEFIAAAKARAEYKAAAWEILAASYASDIAIIEGGSYHGYNGKPFGATPTIVKGVLV